MSPRHVAIGLAVVAVAIAGALGGLREATPTGPGPANPGTGIDTGPSTVTVLHAALHAAIPSLTLSDPAHHWLAVVAEVEVTATGSWASLDEIMRLSDVDGITSPAPREILLLRGDSVGRVGRLHPGLREQVAFVWERANSAPLTELTVEVAGLTWRINPRQGAAAGKQWMLDRSPRATVALPVDDTRATP